MSGRLDQLPDKADNRNCLLMEIATTSLQPGAIVLFDALGFRRIWRRFPPAKVVETLTRLRATTYSASNDVSLYAHIFSDTIAIGATASGTARNPSDGLFWVLDAITHAVRRVLLSALVSDPPLIFRGCIAVGELIATPDVLVGEAVDDAAEHFEKADASIIWLTPKANENWVVWNGSQAATAPYDVPLNDGTKVSTRALNPLAACLGDDQFPWGPEGYLKYRQLVDMAFHAHSTGPLKPSVQAKLEHTRDFLEFCQFRLEIQAERETEMLQQALEDTARIDADA
jgi:hypothetical protein